jgi:hypothetical protein
MSILLEALRQSEKDRHRDAIPTIHSGEPHGPDSDSLRIGPLALLLIAALFACGWFTWLQYQKPSGNDPLVVSLSADQAQVLDSKIAKTGTRDGTSDTSLPEVANAASNQPRTPVESFQQIVNNDSGSKPVDGGESGSKPSENTSPESQTFKILNKKSVVDKPDRKGRTSQKPTAIPTTDAKPSVPAGKDINAGPGAPVSYLELPESIRVRVPEITFSKLIYSSDPADRFVLIDGQRRKEGEWFSPGVNIPGVKLKEIRRNNIILEHNLHQFFAEKEVFPMSYWELPDAVRASIPEIKFSVLVYTPMPADRFILIDGERRVEGEWFEPGPGLPGVKLKEIRRDGIILEQNLYLFFVER